MASTGQATMDTTAAVTQHSTNITPTKSPHAANPIESPEDAATTFTEQDAPLLRLPGEIRNRIYHEVFRTTFNKLEANKEAHERYDPKVLRPALAGLIACRQIHQEATPILFRTYVADKPYWCVRHDVDMTNFFERVKSFCQTMKRYAPQARFGVESAAFSPDEAKAFVEEVARQSAQVAILRFEEPISCPSRTASCALSGDHVRACATVIVQRPGMSTGS